MADGEFHMDIRNANGTVSSVVATGIQVAKTGGGGVVLRFGSRNAAGTPSVDVVLPLEAVQALLPALSAAVGVEL